MIKISIFLVILTIFGFSGTSFGRTTNRFKRAENGYILRSCQASIQLTRKYRTNTGTNIPKRFENLEHLRLTNDDTMRHLSLDVENPTSFTRLGRTSSVKVKEMRQTRDDYLDSPFKTIDVRTTAKDRPPIFKKKDSLPQITRDTFRKGMDSETSIFVVETLH